MYIVRLGSRRLHLVGYSFGDMVKRIARRKAPFNLSHHANDIVSIYNLLTGRLYMFYPNGGRSTKLVKHDVLIATTLDGTPIYERCSGLCRSRMNSAYWKEQQ